jgi:hypothetical protein
MKRLLPILLILCGCVALSQEEDRSPPVSSQDLEILLRAKALLPDEAHWNRHDDRNCPPDAKTLSLFCALHKASVEVLGEYEHRRAALQEVRFAIEEVTKGREFEHRLMDFNNLPETRLADIHRVLDIAAQKVQAKLRPRSNEQIGARVVARDTTGRLHHA